MSAIESIASRKRAYRARRIAITVVTVLAVLVVGSYVAAAVMKVPAPPDLYRQYVYVDPANDTVIVKLSDHGTEQDEQDTFDVLHAVSTGLQG